MSGLDLVETKIIADRAFKWFFVGDFSDKASEEIEDMVVIDETDFDEITM